MKKIDMVGKTFGEWTVLSEYSKGKKTICTCKCSCGAIVDVDSYSLRSGNTTHCRSGIHRGTHGGCFRKERLYTIWSSMKKRCYCRTTGGYDLYGGRGIKVCDEWKNSYENFREWALSNGYADNLTIDRIDPNGNYEPSNCRWATAKMQGNNRRTCLYFTIGGVTKSLMELCEEYGVPYELVRCRLRRGWEIMNALTTPKQSNRYY